MAAIRSETRSLKAAEYRSRAVDAALAAESCGLICVRRTHEQAAAVWTSLAEAVEFRDRRRASGKETLAGVEAS